MAIGGDDGDGFAVVASDDAANGSAGGVGEANGLADAELDDVVVMADLLHEAQALDDDVVEVDQFLFGEQFEDGEDFGEVFSVGRGHGHFN